MAGYSGELKVGTTGYNKSTGQTGTWDGTKWVYPGGSASDPIATRNWVPGMGTTGTTPTNTYGDARDQSSYYAGGQTYTNPDTSAGYGYANSTGTGGYGTVDSSGAAPTAVGTIDLSREAYEKQQQTQLEAQLNQDAFARRLAALSASSGTSPAAGVGHGAGPSFDENQARANAFARAKEAAGLNAQSALASLRRVMESTGRSGSSTEFDRAADILGEGRSGVNTFIDKQLTSDIDRASEIADLTYQGGIEQRGQDLQAKSGLLGLVSASGRLY